MFAHLRFATYIGFLIEARACGMDPRFVQMSPLKEAERLVQEASTKGLKIGNSRLAEWYLAHDGRVFTCFSLSTYDSVGNMRCPSQDDSASILHLWETTTSGHPAAKNLSGRPFQSSQ